MIKLEEWVDIVSLHSQGLSIKAIASRRVIWNGYFNEVLGTVLE